MPLTYSYPGVYVEEVPSGVRTIAGVSTSNTAFVDFFPRGPVDKAVRVTSFEDFTRRFGGLDRRSEASYAVQQYYLNGGSVAWVVRALAPNATVADRVVGVSATYTGASGASGAGGAGGDALRITAASPGEWGNDIWIGIDYNGTAQSDNQPVEFNLVVLEVVNDQVVQSEIFRNLSNADRTSSRFVEEVINQTSSLVRVTSLSLGMLPQDTAPNVVAKIGLNEKRPDGTIDRFTNYFRRLGESPFQTGGDGTVPGDPANDQWENGVGATAIVDSLRRLERIAPEIFNLMCIPAAATFNDDNYKTVVNEATEFCRDHRAFFIVDTPPSDAVNLDNLSDWMKDHDSLRSDFSAIYFPRVRMPDALNANRPREVGPSGTLAGIYARTDASRGVWKAPAGTEAVLRGADLAVQMTDLENGALNPHGINALRSFPVFGNVAWGARTLDGADQKASEYKYIPIRRTALYIEESLYKGLQWVVFEPNDEPLWGQVRLNVGAFLNTMFRQGAFQGRTSREAYFVKCDKDTTTQNDIDRGIVNILVGFAPLKPAEFVVIKLQQIAGQLSV
jgi:phage tail sheath protein FI